MDWKVIFIACAVFAACASDVSAEGLSKRYSPPPRPADPPPLATPAPFSWTGLYVGGSAGFSFANVDHYYDRQNGNNDHGQVWLDASAFTMAGHVGYNHQLPNLVVIGIEAELGFLGLDKQRIVIKDDDILRIDTGLFGTIRGRLGYAFGRFMPYVTAGFTFVDVENAGGNPANAARFLTVSEMRPGFTVGVGAEYAISNNWFARLEYLYIDTPKFEVRNLENEKMWFDNNIHVVRAGLSYRF
jgi:outer membrane immunogenic protein